MNGKLWKARLHVILDGPRLIEGFLYTMEKEEICAKYMSLHDDVSCVELTLDNVAMLAAFRNEQAVASISKLLRNGVLGVAAVCDVKAVGHALCVLPPTDYDCFRIRNRAYVCYCHVDPDYRGRGIYPAMLAMVMETAYAHASITSFSITAALDNVSSHRGIEKVGFHSRHKYRVWQWWKFYWRKVTL